MFLPRPAHNVEPNERAYDVIAEASRSHTIHDIAMCTVIEVPGDIHAQLQHPLHEAHSADPIRTHVGREGEPRPANRWGNELGLVDLEVQQATVHDFDRARKVVSDRRKRKTPEPEEASKDGFFWSRLDQKLRYSLTDLARLLGGAGQKSDARKWAARVVAAAPAHSEVYAAAASVELGAS